MSKERLEELAYNVGISYTGEYARMKADDYVFLYEYALEQAERVQELESESYNAHLERLLDRRERQNKRYREARKIIDQVYEDNFDKTAYGYEDGYLDGLDTAINIIDEAMEESE